MLYLKCKKVRTRDFFHYLMTINLEKPFNGFMSQKSHVGLRRARCRYVCISYLNNAIDCEI